MSIVLSFPIAGLIEIFYQRYLFKVAGIRIWPLDLVYFCMIVSIGNYALRHPRSMGRLLRENAFLAAFLAMIIAYVIIFTPIYGQSAIGEARKFYFMFLFPLQALISIKRTEDLRRLFEVLVFTAGCIAVVALVGVAFHGSIVRVLNAEATFAVALLAIAIMIHRIYSMVVVTPVVDKALLGLFFIIVLGSGQRSASLALALGLMLTFSYYIRRPVLVSKMVMLAIVISMGFTTALMIFPRSGSRLVEKLVGIVDPYSDPTASWRIQSWQAQWNKVQENFYVGAGLGSYYSVKLRGKWEMDVIPHNAYIQMMLKFGLFGLIIYVLLAVQFFRKTLSIRRQLPSGPMRAYVEMGILTFGATHGYILGYGIEPISLIFFAIGLAATSLTQYSDQISPLGARAVRNEARIVSEQFRPVQLG